MKMNAKVFFATIIVTIFALVSITNVKDTNYISIGDYAIVIILVAGFFYIGECIKETKGGGEE